MRQVRDALFDQCQGLAGDLDLSPGIHTVIGHSEKKTDEFLKFGQLVRQLFSRYSREGVTA